MRQDLYYLYLCENGTLLTTAKMSNVPYIKKYRLSAEAGHKITKDGINFYTDTLVLEEEVPQWYEVEAGQK